MTFPTASARIIVNEDGEPMGWDISDEDAQDVLDFSDYEDFSDFPEVDPETCDHPDTDQVEQAGELWWECCHCGDLAPVED